MPFGESRIPAMSNFDVNSACIETTPGLRPLRATEALA